MSNANQEKACNWSVTINNPTPEDFQQWESLKGNHWVKECLGQVEKGENGTPHLQGMVKTHSVRFAQMKKALPRAHIEVARQPVALAKYVVKEDTRLASLPTTKVATQIDIQKRVLKLTLDKYLTTGGENTKEQFYAYLQLENIKDKHYSESWIDASVRELILEGYFGIEFVMCNPQVRMAFKKYFCEIIIRQYGAQDSTQDQAPTQGAQEQSSP